MSVLIHLVTIDLLGIVVSLFRDIVTKFYWRKSSRYCPDCLKATELDANIRKTLLYHYNLKGYAAGSGETRERLLPKECRCLSTSRWNTRNREEKQQLVFSAYRRFFFIIMGKFGAKEEFRLSPHPPIGRTVFIRQIHRYYPTSELTMAINLENNSNRSRDTENIHQECSPKTMRFAK